MRAARTTSTTLPGLGDGPGTRTALTPAVLPKIQEALPLYRYFCRQFGANNFTDLQSALKDTQQDANDDGQTQYYHVLQARDGMKASPANLLQYDTNIQADLARLNRHRSPAIRLTYYQYLALLITEAFLHRRAADADKLRDDLNAFIATENAALTAQHRRWQYQPFATDDLNKVAIWSATGSGKTILMHLNLHQWQRYNAGKSGGQSILLITPNEDLTRQHLREFERDGIAATHVSDNDNGLYAGSVAPIHLIEITKIATSRRGKGQSVTVDELDGYGLVLVDEGHRGASGDTWRELRRRIAERSLTMEYSATFGQIVNGASAAKKVELWTEYSKAILFDYSYPHFYKDGYGKDYHIVNVDDDTGHASPWAMLGSLLGFYEQARLFSEAPDSFRPYNLERPLWVFVGNSVTGGKKESSTDLTDIEEICAFFRDILRDSGTWIGRIGKMLSAQTGIQRADGTDLFAEAFPYLKALGLHAADLYTDVLSVVLRAHPGDALKAAILKNASGEIALRTGSDNRPFAVINVGDVSGLRKLLDDPGQIPSEDDPITSSLFARLNEADSPINVLIGSRKFMEGWDSFRVSSMGLMNIGQGEGSQIIQLFGRGVRLRGKNYCLKRTRATGDVDAPPNMALLETLNVYGIRANYMAKFRENLQNEGIETDFEELTIPIERNATFLQKNLPMLRLTGEYDGNVPLSVDSTISIRIDLRPKVEVAVSRDNVDTGDRAGEYDAKDDIRKHAPLLNWQRILCSVLEFRCTKALHPVAVTEASLRDIIERGSYTVLCLPDYLRLNRFADLRRVEDIVTSLLKQYLSKLYDRRKAKWETDHITLVPLTENDPNLATTEYKVKIAVGQQNLITRIKDLAQTGSELYRQDVANFPNVHFDRHLYQPLLTKDDRIAGIAPPGLEPSETQFLHDLRKYLAVNAVLFAEQEIFLLRNQSRGTGIGFFDSADGTAFYPDFLLWILTKDAQTLAFIDPHGIRNSKGFNDPKHTLWRFLREETEPNVQPPSPSLPIRLNAFILAPDSYDGYAASSWIRDHDQQEWETQQVLFQGDATHMRKLFTAVLG